MGTTIKHLSQRVSLITSDRLWIESAAVQQLITTAELPNITRAVGLPDLHPGRGHPVGAAFFPSIISTRPWWAMILAAAWPCGKPVYR